jgi:hypothetical protein
VNHEEEDRAMAKKKVYQVLKVGDMVKLRYSGIKRGMIVELWGPLAPGGKQA